MKHNLLQITDLGDGCVRIEWQRGNEARRHSKQPIPFTDPLSEEARKELRWYLEEYLQFPYGAERQRAERLKQKMTKWGNSLFKQVFDRGET